MICTIHGIAAKAHKAALSGSSNMNDSSANASALHALIVGIVNATFPPNREKGCNSDVGST